MSQHDLTGRNRMATNGGPQSIQRSYASSLRETEGIFHSYEHLQGLPRGDDALVLLRKVASQVKPIMRKRGWRVQILAEFLPYDRNLLGLNINKGYKICVRLRYHNHPDLFLPIEQIVDTMLHELSHIIWGEHDSKFHALWDELRNEYETLLFKGYTGEGFLSEGQRLGGGRGSIPDPNEMRRLARASAEKRKAQGLLNNSGQRLGGRPLHTGRDQRQVITDQIERRNLIDQGCASGRKDAERLSDNSNITFKTKAEEDDANNRAIAQALFELMEQEEDRKLSGTPLDISTNAGLAWDPKVGLYNPKMMRSPMDRPSPISDEEQMRLAIEASLHPSRRQEFSPVSPTTPIRTISAPSPTRSRPDHSQRRTDGAGRSLSRLVTDGEREGQRRRRVNSHASSVSSLSSGQNGSTSSVARPMTPIVDISEPFDPTQWPCAVCTYLNPNQYLACDACGSERPGPTEKLRRASTGHTTNPRWSAPPRPTAERSMGWNCHGCGTFMEHRWWTCTQCGAMKTTS